MDVEGVIRVIGTAVDLAGVVPFYPTARYSESKAKAGLPSHVQMVYVTKVGGCRTQVIPDTP